MPNSLKTDNSLSYADIIENSLKEATKDQPRIQSIRVYPVCDRDSGNFLIMATGWDKKSWINTIDLLRESGGRSKFKIENSGNEVKS